MTRLSTPSRAMRPTISCRLRQSGVVMVAGMSVPGQEQRTVPMRPVEIPFSLSRCWTRWAVVVLPLVPVIPTTRGRRASVPQAARARTPRVRAGSLTARYSTPSRRVTSAPCA